jgi:D-alanyl-D-alanine carboxypeptidase (penicillin-binding protein 5/6)
MKRLFVALLVLFLFATLAEARPAQKKKTPQGKKAQAAKTQAKSEEPYKAYVVVESSTGKVLEGENADVKRAPASVTKLMLASVVLDKVARGEIKLTDKITASKEASKIGGSQVYLKEGEAFTLEEMMKATLVASGNDTAYAIAEHIGGSKEEFVKLMNEKARTLGMVNSEFHSPHGLPPSKDQQEDHSTCNDLVILAKDLLKYPKLLEWTSIKTEGFRDEKFIMNNHNKLLVKMPGIVDGMKTGYYRETGFNVVATAKKGDLRFIVVVMGSPNAKIRDNVAMEKFKKAFSQYKIINVVKKGEIVDKDINLADGKFKKIKGVANASFLYPMSTEIKGTIKKEIAVPEKITGEVKEGQKLGEIIIKLENEQIGKVDIVSPAHVPMANLFTRLIRKLGFNL